MASPSSSATRDVAADSSDSPAYLDGGHENRAACHDTSNAEPLVEPVDATSTPPSPEIPIVRQRTSQSSATNNLLAASYSVGRDEQDWEDVTEAFSDARKVMSVGEMIHSSKFTLSSAMSAVELMDPKMDVGCGPVRDLNEISLPQSLTHTQVIHIMDRLFSHEMSWLDSHTLAQTVFSCVFTHRLHEIPRSDLFLFARLQLATMHTVSNAITEEKVADEEDFVLWTFGFRLPQLDCRHSDNELDELNDMLEQAIMDIQQPEDKRNEDAQMISAIILRLKLRIAYYYTLRCLSGHYDLSPFEASSTIEQLQQLAQQWASCPYRLGNCREKIIDHELLDRMFDVSINRHLMTSTPPRKAPLFNTEAAVEYFSRLLGQLSALLQLRELALPPHAQLSALSPSGAPAPAAFRYSLHVAIHAVESFCAIHRPTVLTRAFLSRLILIIPEQSSFLFDNESASFSQLIATDMGVSLQQLKSNPHAVFKDNPTANAANTTAKKAGDDNDNGNDASSNDAEAVLDSMRDAVVSIFECFFRNRSRQRRQMLRALRWWDHCAYISTHPNGVRKNENRIDTNSYMRGSFDDDDDDFSSHLMSSTASNTLTPNVASNNPLNGSEHDIENTTNHANSSEQTTGPPHSSIKQNEASGNDDSGSSSSGAVLQTLEGKTPLQLVAYEVCCRLMIQHWLLGFECELYHEFEYAAIFFYIGYVLSNLSNATTALAQCGLNDAELHPLRFALHLMDEARLWLCRALYLLIEALSSGDHWDYTCQRERINKKKHNRRHANDGKIFGSEALWYEQRFGVAMNLINGPPYANYSSFVAVSKMHCDSLLQQQQQIASHEKDLVALRLQEACALFVVARRKLEKSKKFAQPSPCTGQNFLVDEILKLGRVTVENSLSATQIIRDYLRDRKLAPKKRPQYSVNFVLSRHPHFPVVKVTEKT